ncbi:MAG: AraC family transcriptional regulator [Spirochaetota bacterium]
MTRRTGPKKKQKTNTAPVMSVDTLIAQYRVFDGTELADAIRRLQNIGDRISFTEAGRGLGCFPQIRIPTHATAFSEHRHDFFEISFILDGAARHAFSGNIYPVRQGDIFFMDDDTPHRFIVGKTERLTVLNIAFLPEFLESAITLDKLKAGVHFFLVEPFFRTLDSAEGKLSVSGDTFFRFAVLALSIVDAFVRSFPEKSEVVPNLFKAFIQLVNDEYARTISEHSRFHEKREVLFREIVSFIDARLSKKISVTDIGSSVGLGRTRLAEVFRERQGMTIIEYVNRRRVEQAKELLRTTDMPVIDIAMETGFNDVSNFNRTFKKIAGMPPSQLRKSER